jgi:hypothetical protein
LSEFFKCEEGLWLLNEDFVNSKLIIFGIDVALLHNVDAAIFVSAVEFWPSLFTEKLEADKLMRDLPHHLPIQEAFVCLPVNVTCSAHTDIFQETQVSHLVSAESYVIISWLFLSIRTYTSDVVRSA